MNSWLFSQKFNTILDIFKQRASMHTQLLVSSAQNIDKDDSSVEKVQSLIHFRRYQEASQMLLTLQNSEEKQLLLQRMNNVGRIVNDKNFHYLLAQARSSFYVDVCDYVSDKIELFTMKDRGRGYRAVYDIQPGQLIMMTKALAICVNGNIEDYGYQIELQKQYGTQESKKQYEAMYYGDLKNQQDLGKYQYNCFALQYSFEQTAIYNNFFNQQVNVAVTTPNSALLNHECLPNTLRFFIGDVQFIIARQLIRKQTEVTTSYQFFSYRSLLQSRELMKKNYGFDCTCRFCSALNTDQHRELDRLIEALEGQNATSQEALKYRDRILQIYDDARVSRLDRALATHANILLARARRRGGEAEAAEAALLENLRILGIKCDLGEPNGDVVFEEGCALSNLNYEAFVELLALSLKDEAKLRNIQRVLYAYFDRTMGRFASAPEYFKDLVAFLKSRA